MKAKGIKKRRFLRLFFTRRGAEAIALAIENPDFVLVAVSAALRIIEISGRDLLVDIAQEYILDAKRKVDAQTPERLEQVKAELEYEQTLNKGELIN